MKETITFKKNEVIFCEGDESYGMYKVENGRVAIYQHYKTTQEKRLAIVTEGFIGEMGLLEKKARNATAVAMDNVQVLMYTEKEAKALFKEDSVFMNWMLEQISFRINNVNTHLMEVNNKLLAYSDTTEEKVKPKKETVNSEFVPGEKSFKAGDVIIREGAYERWCYDLKEGRVGVYKAYGTPEEKKLAEIESGVFGEMGLFITGVRTATVVALEDTVCDTISAYELSKLVTCHTDKADEILETLIQRLREVDDLYDDACLTLTLLESGEKKPSMLMEAIHKFTSLFR